MFSTLNLLAFLADQYDTFLFDCDGVLWRGGKLLDGSDTALAMLRWLEKLAYLFDIPFGHILRYRSQQPVGLVPDRRKGKRIFFVTNNSTKSRAQYAKKLHGLGIEAT